MEPRLSVGAHVPIHAHNLVDRPLSGVNTGHKPTVVRPPKIPNLRTTVVLTVAMALTIASTTRATTIVLLISRDRIVIAADSMETGVNVELPLLSRATVTPMPAVDVCKVQLGRHIAFVASGTVRGAVEGRGFDVHTIAKPILQNGDTIVEKYAELFAEVIRIRLPSVDADYLDVAFLAWEDGRPQFMLGTFKQHTYPGPPPFNIYDINRYDINRLLERTLTATRFHDYFDQTWLSVCTGPSCTFAKVLGKGSAIDKDALNAALRRRPKEAEMVRLAEEAVKAQSAATPDLVGGPISSVVINKKGARWIHQSENCR
jgi:hypothetical protein